MAIRHSTEAIVVHCTASKFGVPQTVEQVRHEHMIPKSKGGYLGAKDIGYHYLIGLNGEQWEARKPVNSVGAHAKGFNDRTVSVSYVGGIGKDGKPTNTLTEDQEHGLLQVIKHLLLLYPQAVILGHRDLSPDLNKDGKIQSNEWIKICPCFDAGPWAVKHGLPGGKLVGEKFVRL